MKILKIITFFLLLSSNAQAQKYLMDVDVNEDSIPPKYGYKRKINYAAYLGFGFPIGNSTDKPPSEIKYGYSYNFCYGIWFRYKVSKFYSLGSSIEYNREEYNLKKSIISDSNQNFKIKTTKQISNNAALSVFNRFNFSEDYFYIETGVFCAYDVYPKIITKATSDNDYRVVKSTYLSPKIINRFNYGVDFKITYDFVSFYTRYRISGLYKDKNYDLPKLSIGLLVNIGD